MRLVFAAIAFALATLPARALELAEGDYQCTISRAYLGDIRIAGSTYSGPAYDEAFGESYPFTLSDDGVILWGGPLGGISEAGKIVSTVLKNAGGGQIGFDVTIQNDSGNFQTISCAPN